MAGSSPVAPRKEKEPKTLYLSGVTALFFVHF